MNRLLVIGYQPNNIAARVLDDWYGESDYPSRTQIDLTEDEEVIDDYLLDNGPYTHVLYAAAVNELRWIKDIQRIDMIETYLVNVFGFVSVVASHLKHFPDEPTRFVTVVSDAARTPMRGSLLYGSSKTALTGVIRNMARELAPKQTVVGVSPTVVGDTPMTDYIDEAVPLFRGWDPVKAAEYEKSNIPIGRRVTKDEVASTIMFALNGPDALTGSIIEITGGK